MNNYFDFLSKEEQLVLDTERFANSLSPVLREKIYTFLESEYEIFCDGVPVPTNHQIECFLQMKENVNDDTGFSFALFMEQGLGKTKSALMMVEYLYGKEKIDSVLIISPNNLKYQWVEEQIPLHFPYPTKMVVWDGMGSAKKRNEFGELLKSNHAIRFFSVNVEAFSAESIKQYVHMFCKASKGVMIIVDESTSIKNGRRKPKGRSQRKGAKRTNLILDGFQNRRYKMILTGTATPNRPFDLWAQFEFLRYDFFHKDYWDFCKYHGEMMQVKHANAKRHSLELLDEKTFSMVKSDLKSLYMENCIYRQTCMTALCSPDKCSRYKQTGITPYQLEEIAQRRGLTESGVLRIADMKELIQFKNLDQLKESISGITYFCKTEEVLDLPEKVYQTIPCELSPEQRKLYKEMEHNMMTEYEGEQLTTLFKQVMYMRCQQIAGGLFPFPVDIIKKGYEEGDQIFTEYRTKPIATNGKLSALSIALDDIDPDQSKIYWSWFVGEQDLIYSMLCEKYGSQYVGLYRNNKKEVERAFKAGEIIHFVSGDSGSFGLNLQKSFLQFFYSNNHRADIRDQKEKRSHRIGQNNTVVYNDLICRGTKDQKILDILKRKMNLIDYFRSGDDREPSI